MNQKLYVGNLPYNTTDASLGELFAQAGSVASASVITDKMSGRSKGFGFVEMSTPEEASAAIEKFHGQEFDGRALTVSEARPKEDRPQRSFGGGNDRGGNNRSW
jgi:cold-inducible RNA-binding protein